MFITHRPTLTLQLHNFHLFRTCRTSSFRTVAWQLARFQLTWRIARSLGDSWASCCLNCTFAEFFWLRLNLWHSRSRFYRPDTCQINYTKALNSNTKMSLSTVKCWNTEMELQRTNLATGRANSKESLNLWITFLHLVLRKPVFLNLQCYQYVHLYIQVNNYLYFYMM